jgi:DNA-directed RNA polymerase specialized sigma24 family protein
MLFQRILVNCTLDWFRRQKTRNALFSNMSDFETDDLPPAAYADSGFIQYLKSAAHRTASE